MNYINWPERYTPGTTDNYVSNEIIVKGLSIDEVWKYIVETKAWPHFYSNVSNIKIYDSSDSKLFDDAKFQFKTFVFIVEASVIEFVPPANGKPGRIAWEGKIDGNDDEKLDVVHAWLFEEVYDGCVRILTQESQIGVPAKQMSVEIPNPMLNAHQEWITGLAKAAGEKISY